MVIGLLSIAIFALFFLLVAGVIRLPGLRRSKTAVQTSSTPAPETPVQPVIIQCPQCSAKLRVSGGNEMLKVTCPKCGHSFFWYNSTVQEAPRSTNELDAYREGGQLWLNPRFEPHTAREATLGLIATMSGSFIETLFSDDGPCADFLKEFHCSIDFVDLLHTGTEVVFTLYFRNAPEPNHAFRYTYNEWINRTAEAPIILEDGEQTFVRRVALSHLTELMPDAYMREGRIYERKQ